MFPIIDKSAEHSGQSAEICVICGKVRDPYREHPQITQITQIQKQNRLAIEGSELQYADCDVIL